MQPGALTPDRDAVERGFSAKAAEYDELAVTHPVVRWMRDRIRATALRELGPPPASVLEVNAGSGLDAAYFAGAGYRVHASDIAPGMLDALSLKASLPEIGGRLTFEKLSLTDLDQVSGRPYDLVFSNLGGLNCIPRLEEFTRGLPSVLRPGGVVVCAVMPPVCPWEVALVVRGHWRTALRRLRGRTVANVEGARVRVWYHAPGMLTRALGTGFRTVSLRSFCLFCPPSYFQGLARRHPRLIQLLTRVDDELGRLTPLNRAGDFYVLVSRYEGR
jgi:SAM-dependent methyltransferase